jgi:N-ethylmaleimide reductase
MRQGRTEIITGAAGGRGELFVQRFLANNDTVVATNTFHPLATVLLVINGVFDKGKANAALSANHADLTSFGVTFLANPDLLERFRNDASINKSDPKPFYGIGAKGYADYTALEVSATA